MTEETTTPKKTPKKKNAKRKAAPKAAVIAGPFAGLTVTDCCDDCNVDGCVISGKPYCAHPRKGGLHSQEIQQTEPLRRLQQAKKLLGKQMLDLRGE